MKKPSVLSRFFISYFLLLLLPLATCLIFSLFAIEYGHSDAMRHIQNMEEAVQTIMESSLGPSDTPPPGTAGNQAMGIAADKPPVFDYGSLENPHPSDTFLRAVSHLADISSSSAHIMVVSYDLDILFPNNDPPSKELTLLSQDFITAAENGFFPNDRSLLTAEGDRCLVSMVQPLAELDAVRYIFCYYPIMESLNWVRHAALLVLIITAAAALIIFLILFFSVSKVTGSLSYLNSEAKRIGGGDFEPSRAEFSLREPEELRLAMNSMAGKLKSAQAKRIELFLNISHRLKTRLMGISSYADMIEQGISEPSKAGEHIRKESESLAKDVENLITYSKLEDPLTEVTMEPVPVIEVLENCLDRFSVIGKQKNISLNLDVCKEEVFAFGNEDMLEDILDNLLSNAIRYAKARIIISVRSEAGNINLKVGDDGKGLDENDLSKLFEPFYKGQGGNFGLGMPVAKRSAQLMHGSLTAANRPDGGAEFTLTLPKA